MPALDVLNKAVALFETGIESGSIHMSENMVSLTFAIARDSMLTECTFHRKLCATCTAKPTRQWKKPEVLASDRIYHCARTNLTGSLV
jgi:hypothetical protein